MADNYVQDASYFGGGYFGGTTYSYWGVYGNPIIYGRQVLNRKTVQVASRITGEMNERVTAEVESYYGDRDCQ